MSLEEIAEKYLTFNYEKFILESLNKGGLAKQLAKDLNVDQEIIMNSAKKWMEKSKKQVEKPKLVRKKGAGRPATGYSLSYLKPIVKKINGGKGPENYSKWNHQQLCVFIVKKISQDNGEKPEKGYKKWTMDQYKEFIEENYNSEDYD